MLYFTVSILLQIGIFIKEEYPDIYQIQGSNRTFNTKQKRTLVALCGHYYTKYREKPDLEIVMQLKFF